MKLTMEAKTMGSSNKSLLIVNNIFGEYFSYEEAYIISENRLEFFSTNNDNQSANYTFAHKTIEYNQETKCLVDKYLPLIKRYLNDENNKIREKELGNNTDKFVSVLETNSNIDSIKTAEEIAKEASVYYSFVFFVLLRCIIPEEYLSKEIRSIICSSAKDELDRLLEKEFNNELKHPKEVSLGEYPQGIVKEQSIIDALDQKYLSPEQSSSWIGFADRANDFDGPYMFYIDVVLDGQKYRGVYLKQYRPNVFGDNIARNNESAQKHNGFKLNTNYWFKYSPLVWLIINDGKQEIYLSKYVLDAEPIVRGGEETRNDLLPLIKNTFSYEKNKEASLLTIEEYKEIVPYKATRKPIWTDYSLIKGFLTEQVAWYSPFVWAEGRCVYNHMPCISIEGTIIDDCINNYGYRSFTIGGVRPALRNHNKEIIR